MRIPTDNNVKKLFANTDNALQKREKGAIVL